MCEMGHVCLCPVMGWERRVGGVMGSRCLPLWPLQTHREVPGSRGGVVQARGEGRRDMAHYEARALVAAGCCMLIGWFAVSMMIHTLTLVHHLTPLPPLLRGIMGQPRLCPSACHLIHPPPTDHSGRSDPSLPRSVPDMLPTLSLSYLLAALPRLVSVRLAGWPPYSVLLWMMDAPLSW